MRALAVLALAVTPMVGLAERPPQKPADADLVVVGLVHEIIPKEEKFGNNGILTRYLAQVKVTGVERGKGVKAGEGINVRWFRVTREPSKPIAGAFGHAYPIRAGNIVRFWLMKDGKDWSVIYNSKGAEVLMPPPGARGKP
jgi:hypothetical protein